jgi:hypothetical protein
MEGRVMASCFVSGSRRSLRSPNPLPVGRMKRLRSVGLCAIRFD